MVGSARAPPTNRHINILVRKRAPVGFHHEEHEGHEGWHLIYGDDVCKRTFNLFNQMVAYEAPDGTRTEYAYDALGRRILKKIATFSGLFLFMGFA
jgi:YD repeat-containing protein